MVGAIAMSEPAPARDLQGIKSTRRSSRRRSYLLNGSKTFITNGWLADLVIVVAKTDPAAGRQGHLPPARRDRGMKGFESASVLKKMGLKAQDTSELFFDNVRVPAENLLGGARGQGLHLPDGATCRTSALQIGVTRRGLGGGRDRRRPCDT